MKISFKCYLEHGAIFEANTIMEKSCGLVVIGEVKNNTLSEGETVGIQADDKIPHYDTILRIELNGKKISEAAEGMMIGICLPKTTKYGLLQYLGK